jgi:hypothetical protein
MDTTPEYIKMNQKAMKYIPYYPTVGDWCFLKHDITSPDDMAHGLYFDEDIIIIEDRQYDNSELTPLYRQDQLQDMMNKSPGQLLWEFYSWYQDRQREATLVVRDKLFFRTSMEQLWLSFVMFELYHKTWNGEDWVKTN